MPALDIVSAAAGAGAGLALGWCAFARGRAAPAPEGAPLQESAVNQVEPDPRRKVEADGTMFYDDENELGEVQEGSKMLPGNVYGEVVRRMPLVCVDVVIRNAEGKVLILKRGMHPVKGYWWLPGGRMLKGETFFRAAVRKCHQETGILCKPLKLLGMYNTIFPTSSWDDDEAKGTHTVNAVVLMDIGRGDVKIDETSTSHRWIDADVASAEAEGYDRYIVEQLRRMAAAGLA